MNKEEIIKSLEKAKQIKTHMLFMGRILSIDQLIKEVQNETELGRKFIEMMNKHA